MQYRSACSNDAVLLGLKSSGVNLLADLPRLREDESVLKFHGSETSLELCLVDGAEDLKDHVETIYISCREGEEVETFELTVPDCVGFLMLKALGGHRKPAIRGHFKTGHRDWPET